MSRQVDPFTPRRARATPHRTDRRSLKSAPGLGWLSDLSTTSTVDALIVALNLNECIVYTNTCARSCDVGTVELADFRAVNRCPSRCYHSRRKGISLPPLRCPRCAHDYLTIKMFRWTSDSFAEPAIPAMSGCVRVTAT